MVQQVPTWAKHLQTLAQVLQAVERHITDRDMSPDPLWGPVIDGPDLKVVLVGAEAGFDFPQLVISGTDSSLKCKTRK